MSRRLGIGGLLLLVALAGCNGESTRTFQVGNVTVVDETGLVTSAEALDATPVEAATAVAGDSLTRVVVSWPADSCVENWLVRLAGNALRLTIEPGTRLISCAGTFAYHAVELTLNRVVDADAIDVSLAGES